MAEPERQSDRARRLVIGTLAVVCLAGLLAPWLAPYPLAEQLDTVSGQLLPPLSVRHAVELDDGSWLLAERVERTAGGLRIERLGRTEELDAARVANLDDDGVRDRRIFILGSDQFSRDVLSRLLHGARISLAIGLTAVLLAMSIGIIVGTAAALGGRWLDALLMRLVDGLLSFPWIFLLIALVAVLPPSTITLVLLLGGTAWMGISRVTRAQMLSLESRDFVVAARGLGAHPLRVIWSHMLPNAMTPLVVEATLRVGRLILVEAALSFLGFGVQPPQASWGTMIADGRSHMFSAWWIAGFPGAALVITIIAITLASDTVRDLLDPRTA